MFPSFELTVEMLYNVHKDIDSLQMHTALKYFLSDPEHRSCSIGTYEPEANAVEQYVNNVFAFL